MSKNAAYLSNEVEFSSCEGQRRQRVKKPKVLNSKAKKVLAGMLLVLTSLPVFLAIFVGVFAQGSGSQSVYPSVSASAETPERDAMTDFSRYFMCDMAGSLAIEPLRWFRPDVHLILDNSDQIYQWATTDDIPFYLQSKSAIVSPRQEVDNYLPNRILNMTTGPTFGEVNDWVVENERPEGTTNIEGQETEEYEGNAGVSPYDRFGFAGMNWSSYGGEWKYYQVDACNPEESSDPQLNIFYETRLEPKSTFEGVGDSPDPRSQQFTVPWTQKVWYGVTNTFSGHIFSFSKFVVALTIAMVSFAFGDIPSMLGFDTIILGDSGDGRSGIFGSLYQGIFMPFVALAFLITAGVMGYKGFFKRQYRGALGDLLKSVLCLISAVVVAIFPSFFVSAPNNFSVFMQAGIMQAFSGGSAGGDGLCETSISELMDPDSPSGISPSDPDRSYGFMESIGASISSGLGCTMWQSLILYPWAQGQFGTNWDQVYAENYAPSGAGSIGNDSDPSDGQDNGSWVGDADVALGNDEYINNWALFQISTQTDSHYDVTIDMLNPHYTEGVNNDWWRIVDAFSNYNEETLYVPIDDEVDAAFEGGSPDLIGDTVIETQFETTVISDTDVTEHWNAWIGNNQAERLGMALVAVIFGITATIPLLILSFLTAIYALGLMILMAFAPIMLLFGCWAGAGWRIFMSWLELLLNTVMKRIGYGILLVVMISVTVASLDMLDELGFFRAFIALIIMSFLIIKNKDKIIEKFAFIRFASSDPGMSNVAQKISNRSAFAGKALAGAGAMAAAGTAIGAHKGNGIAGSLSGGFRGASTGFKSSVKTSLEQAGSGSNALKFGRMEFEERERRNTGKHRQDIGGYATDIYCAFCGKIIDDTKERHYKSKNNGLVYHLRCGDQGNFLFGDSINTVQEMGIRASQEKKKAMKEEKAEQKAEKKQQERSERLNRIEQYNSTPEENHSDRERMQYLRDVEKEEKDQESERKAIERKAKRRSESRTGARYFKGKGVSAADNARNAVDNAYGIAENVEDDYLSELIKKLGLDLEDVQDRDMLVAMRGFEGSLEDLEKVHEQEQEYREFDKENFDGYDLDIPEMPEQIRDKVDSQVLQNMIANAKGDYSLASDYIANAWIEWYEEQGMESQSDAHIGGYDYNKVETLNFNIYARSRKYSQDAENRKHKGQYDDDEEFIEEDERNNEENSETEKDKN